MTPLPPPHMVTQLTDREILLLTVNAVNELAEDVAVLTQELRERAPNSREKRALMGGAAAGALALMGFIGDMLLK